MGESIFTQGETWKELQIQIRDAVDCHFEENKPQIIRLVFLEFLTTFAKTFLPLFNIFFTFKGGLSSFTCLIKRLASSPDSSHSQKHYF